MSTHLSLGIDLATLDLARAINLTQAAKLLRGRKGPVHCDVARRWANPRRGYRPQGAGGPVLLLPCVRVGGQLLTMPEWVEAFERVRVRLGGGRRLAPTVRPRRTREAALRRAEARLDRAGIGSQASGSSGS